MKRTMLRSAQRKDGADDEQGGLRVVSLQGRCGAARHGSSSSFGGSKCVRGGAVHGQTGEHETLYHHCPGCHRSPCGGLYYRAAF